MGLRGQPVAGYPSRTAALVALYRQNKSDAEIAVILGTSEKAVGVNLSKLRALGHDLPHRRVLRAGGTSPISTPAGEWPAARVAKAQRIFKAAMQVIAEALQAPPGELLGYCLEGKAPPPIKAQKYATLLLAAPAPVPAPTPPPAPRIVVVTEEPDETEPGEDLNDDGEGDDERRPFVDPDSSDTPSREDDEAELAALSDGNDNPEEDDNDDPEQSRTGAAEGKGGDARGADGVSAGTLHAAPVVPVAAQPERVAFRPDALRLHPAVAPSTGRLHYLRRFDDGKYLHQSIEALTTDRRYAWQGTLKQMEAIFARRPEWRELEPERVPEATR